MVVSGTAALAQTDTTTIEVQRGRVEGVVKDPDLPENFHDPAKAALYSALLPGLGQVYNKKYWKVPIIYAGFAAAGYFLHDNLEQIDFYKDAYVADIDDDPTTVNETGYTLTQLNDIIDQYKQWRDLSYIAIAAIYVLNIVDANVDAHLFYFDVSKDISLHWSPYLDPYPGRNTAGLTFALKL